MGVQQSQCVSFNTKIKRDHLELRRARELILPNVRLLYGDFLDEIPTDQPGCLLEFAKQALRIQIHARERRLHRALIAYMPCEGARLEPLSTPHPVLSKELLQ